MRYRAGVGSLLLMVASLDVSAADSYRWLHVTIDTPWLIFIFLLPMVLIPAILMAFLYWRFAGEKKAVEDDISVQPDSSDEVKAEIDEVDRKAIDEPTASVHQHESKGIEKDVV